MSVQLARRPTRVAVALALGLAPASWADKADTFDLTDEPGNWFRSEATGSPFTVVAVGDEVDFRINNCCTNTRHTVTLLVRPVGSSVVMDQPSSQNGTLSAEFDVPGVYVFLCKVHPYMTAVVAVTDAQGNIPDVQAAALPFLAHLGVRQLPAADVLAVLTTLAATDADKLAKWDIRDAGATILPTVPGVGEVWINTQFERVPGQTDSGDVPKPGTITVLDAATFAVEREINGLGAEDHMWNNPHNLWGDFSLSSMYNSNWFGKWINKIDRATGAIIASQAVGEAPTHIITIPTGPQAGILMIPISADNDMVKVEDAGDELNVIDSEPTGEGETHPPGHWLTCGDGARTIVPNVFKGLGVAGSISVVDTATGKPLIEFLHDAADPLRSALTMPIAAGECHVDGVHTAYVANLFSGMVTVIDVDSLCILKNIPVTLTPDGLTGFDLTHTLQGPSQTPVSPDERWVVTAVVSLTTVDRPQTGTPDHVALIDTHSNEVVKFLPGPGGTHGANWGAKLGGGYYCYITGQHSNVLAVLDPDPNNDGSGDDAAIVGEIVLANGSVGAGPTDGTGGQGVKPIPITHDGWIQNTVALAQGGQTSAEVAAWIAALTPAQRDPADHHVPGTPGDLNGDGAVDGADLGLLLAEFGGPGDGDLDGDCVVDGADLGVLLANWR